eukprot:8358044-Pyramimonas_sp.AAC.1
MRRSEPEQEKEDRPLLLIIIIIMFFGVQRISIAPHGRSVQFRSRLLLMPPRRSWVHALRYPPSAPVRDARRPLDAP